MRTLLRIFYILYYYIRRYDPCTFIGIIRAFPSAEQTSVGCTRALTHTHTHLQVYTYKVPTTWSILYLPVERTLECSHLSIYIYTICIIRIRMHSMYRYIAVMYLHNIIYRMRVVHRAWAKNASSTGFESRMRNKTI